MKHGRIQVRSYTAQDGQKCWVTEVISEDVRFLSPKDGGSGSNEEGSPYGREVNLDDEIPF